MNRLFFISLLVVAIAGKALADDGQWLMLYYKEPKPDDLARLLPEWQKEGAFDPQKGQAVTLGFSLTARNEKITRARSGRGWKLPRHFRPMTAARSRSRRGIPARPRPRTISSRRSSAILPGRRRPILLLFR